MQKLDREFIVRTTADVVVAYFARNSIEPADVPSLIREIRAALEASPEVATRERSPPVFEAQVSEAVSEASEPEEPEVPRRASTARPPRPAVPVDESVHDDYLVSLEDGARFRSLRRHLMAKYGMTPEEYRQKWNLPDDYPMVAPSYARDRSEVAKRIGLGRKPEAGRGQRRRM